MNVIHYCVFPFLRLRKMSLKRMEKERGRLALSNFLITYVLVMDKCGECPKTERPESGKCQNLNKNFSHFHTNSPNLVIRKPNTFH